MACLIKPTGGCIERTSRQIKYNFCCSSTQPCLLTQSLLPACAIARRATFTYRQLAAAVLTADSAEHDAEPPHRPRNAPFDPVHPAPPPPLEAISITARPCSKAATPQLLSSTHRYKHHCIWHITLPHQQSSPQAVLHHLLLLLPVPPLIGWGTVPQWAVLLSTHPTGTSTALCTGTRVDLHVQLPAKLLPPHNAPTQHSQPKHLLNEPCFDNTQPAASQQHLLVAAAAAAIVAAGLPDLTLTGVSSGGPGRGTLAVRTAVAASLAPAAAAASLTPAAAAASLTPAAAAASCSDRSRCKALSPSAGSAPSAAAAAGFPATSCCCRFLCFLLQAFSAAASPAAPAAGSAATSHLQLQLAVLPAAAASFSAVCRPCRQQQTHHSLLLVAPAPAACAPWPSSSQPCQQHGRLHLLLLLPPAPDA